ncbi:MAG: HAMP domain-containing histidine kinase [Bacteroidetes bacterium]|nr:HAMP domain-containing histidine kinase [Bacteroidota bacterium]
MTLLVVGIVLATTQVVNYLRKEEIKRINLLSKSIKIQKELTSPDPAILDLLPEILNINSTIPVIVTDKNKIPIPDEGYHRNIPDNIWKNPQKLKALMQKMENSYRPFEIEFPDGNNQFVYYDNSALLNNLRYTPYLLGLIILGYFLFSFWFMKTLKKTDEGFLWAGLAKETAHQIGTPLSSMIGWMEVMKLDNPQSEAITEVEKDINRLKTISERFSKIGSVPELNDTNLSDTVLQNYEYLKKRISTKVNFQISMPKEEIWINHNKILMSWVIENLVKNAVDAMKGNGQLEISLYEKSKNIIIDCKDSGCGMTSKQTRNVFKPGFSTKKRGWGLGLSLAKRVINEYHKGEIKIAQSEVGKGSIFRIIFKTK